MSVSFIDFENFRLTRWSQIATAIFAAETLSKQMISYNKTIQSWAINTLQRTEIKKALTEINVSKSQTLAQRGGFTAIKERIEKGKWTKEDYETILNSLKNRANRQSFVKAQERDRGGRSL